MGYSPRGDAPALGSPLLPRTMVVRELHRWVSAADLDDLNIEIIRNTLYKAYLEDFDAFCTSLGGPTAEIMHRILSFEADRRAINITINSFGTQLSKEQRAKLFPTIGRLFPEGNNALARAADHIFITEIRAAGVYDEMSQAYVAISQDRAVGVQGDARVYGYIAM